MAVAALACGVLAILLAPTVVGGIVLAVAAAVLGIVGLRRPNRHALAAGGLAAAGVAAVLVTVLVALAAAGDSSALEEELAASKQAQQVAEQEQQAAEEELAEMRDELEELEEQFAAIEARADEAEEAAARAEDEDAAEADEATSPSTENAADKGSRNNPNAIGEPAVVGDYEVTVVAFNGNATEQVLAENTFNDPPDDGNVYGLVRIRATYLGAEEGMAGSDLSVGLMGDDQRRYVDHDCGAVEPESLHDEPAVAQGGVAEGNFCLDVPASQIESGMLFVEPLMTFDGERVWWATS